MAGVTRDRLWAPCAGEVISQSRSSNGRHDCWLLVMSCPPIGPVACRPSAALPAHVPQCPLAASKPACSGTLHLCLAPCSMQCGANAEHNCPLVGIAASDDCRPQAHASLVEDSKLPRRQPLVVAIQCDLQLAAAVAALLQLAAVHVGAVPHLHSQGMQG